MITVIMRQISKNYWAIISPSGKVMKDEITVWSASEAEKYVKNYVSSFRGWTYKVEPLKEKI